MITTKYKSLLAICLIGLTTSQLSYAQTNQGNLENPVANSVESGITVISGWHCDASDIELFIDGVSQGKAGLGTTRTDTESVCGHSDSGFSLLINYGNYEPGPHLLEVSVDGEPWLQRNFSTIRSTGEPFTAGLEKSVIVQDFPQKGDLVKLDWVTAKQSFVATGAEQNLLDKNRVMNNLNHSFVGASKGYRSGQLTSATQAEAATFSFQVTDDEFSMQRSTENSGDCSFSGPYELSLAGLSSQGTFECSQSSGSYSATISVTREGLYLGSFVITDSAANSEIRDTQTGLRQ